jgi:peptidyl-tRNA hydrolase
MAQKADSSEFVLGKFTQQEQADLPSVIKEASAMITEYIFSGQLPHDTRTIL